MDTIIICGPEGVKMTPGGPQKSKGDLLLGGTSRKNKTISTFHAGKGGMGCTKTSNVIGQVGWNRNGGLGIEHRLGRTAEMNEQRLRV